MLVQELKGFKGYRAFQAFHKLMLGMKMLPLHQDETYEDFYNRFAEADDKVKKQYISDALLFVDMEPSEVEALACFVKDKNGIPYSKTNINNLKPNELKEILCSVCMEIGKIDIDMISNEEKKN